MGAGGLSWLDALGPGKDPSEMAQGGAYQKDIGCTRHEHCDIGSSFGPRFCNTVTHRCTTVPPAPTPPPATNKVCGAVLELSFRLLDTLDWDTNQIRII